LSGDRARICLEELEGFFKANEQALTVRLLGAKTPESAWEITCEYKALAALRKTLLAHISAGNIASGKLLSDE
jgi:hypothetical protein